jgi:hypothetical protein
VCAPLTPFFFGVVLVVCLWVDISLTDAFAPTKKNSNSGGFQGTALFGGLTVASDGSEIDLTMEM